MGLKVDKKLRILTLQKKGKIFINLKCFFGGFKPFSDNNSNGIMFFSQYCNSF